ncbi:hypothetical protein, unknown function [Leishmania donovani]|uniref:3'-5' exonuclease family protein n=1 Tax=Leishmania donovani TaxID=5661 RepID=A0A3S7X5Q4_LEIDO|nr:hypothetical protein, unknown function [Leishmania donovani]AYU81745.1 3'-5' exonuclease, putative [Leishmania donovani]TPP43709.1 3'-5' exonuclease family protein [Leishmania donovani]CBZ36929.1 hypothetical protein, unknown function [Leishmania donovani]
MMPPAIEVGKSAYSVEEVGAKGMDEVNTHTSVSLCSSSSSTDAYGQTTTATAVSTLKARAPSPIVKRGSCSISSGSNECVSCDLRMPTPPTPCEFLEDLSLASTAAVGALCVGVKVVSDSAALALTPISPLSTTLAKRRLAPPYPIDFPEATSAVAATAAAGGPVDALESASQFASSLRLSSFMPKDASALSDVAAAPSAFSVASFSGNGSRPPLPPTGLHTQAGPLHSEKPKTINNAAISSFFSTPQQTYASPCDYAPVEHRPSLAMSSLRYCEGCSAVKSGLLPQPHVGNSPVSLRSAQHPPGTSHPHHIEVGFQSSGNALDAHWQAASSLPRCHGRISSSTCSPAGMGALSRWKGSGLADEGYSYGTCVENRSIDGVTGANGTSAAASSGAEQSGLSAGMADGCGSRPHSVARDSRSPPTPPRGLYPSAPFVSLAAHASAPQQIIAPPPHLDLMRMGGGEYEYSTGKSLAYNTGPEYGDGRDIRFRGCVPQDVVCIEHMDHLEHVCREILLESEMLRMQREQQRRERVYSVDNNNAEEAHYTDTLTIALDLEGRSLGRMGSICIITLATYSTVYIIDVVMLGAEALRSGSPLQRVLESRDIMKLMFDCRADCDALFFLYCVRLQNVCDLQISSCFALFPTSPHLPGMKSVFLALGLFTDEDTGIKNAGRHLFNPRCGGSFDRWEERPLTDVLVQYCAVDVKYFFAAQLILWDHVEQGCRLGEARLASVCNGNFRGSSKSNSFRDFDVRNEL